MRLYEIKGFKSSNIYKAAQGLKPKGPDQAFNISFDLESFRTLTKALQEQGWERISGGTKSNVYTNFKYPYMVKIFVNDPEYLRYFKLVKQLQANPHVPKVRGNPVEVGDQGYVVRLEPLIPLDGPTDAIFKHYVDPRLQPTFDNLLSQDNMEFLQKNHPQFLDLFDDITDLSSELDWHDGNLMKRGNTLVITDPLA
jgi:hypothetical protein